MDGWREREREQGRKTRREREREIGRGRKREERRTMKPIQNTKFAPQQKSSLVDKRLTSADKHEPEVVGSNHNKIVVTISTKFVTVDKIHPSH